MNYNEVAALLAMFNELPLANKPKPTTPEGAKRICESYYRLLEPYDKDTILAAAKIHLERSPYYPTPSHLIGNIQRAENLKAYNRNMRTAAAIAPERTEMPLNDVQSIKAFNYLSAQFDACDRANRTCTKNTGAECPIERFKTYREHGGCDLCPEQPKQIKGGNK